MGIGNEFLMASPAVQNPNSPEGSRDSGLGAGADLHSQFQQLIREDFIGLYLFIYAVQRTQCSLKTHRDGKYSQRASKESFISGMTGSAPLKPASECPTLSTMSPPEDTQGWSNPHFQGGLHK